MRVVPIALLMLLSACGGWPDLPRDEAGLPTGFPPLVRTESIPDPGGAIEKSQSASDALEARAALLRARAAILSGDAADDEAREDIRSRLAPPG